MPSKRSSKVRSSLRQVSGVWQAKEWGFISERRLISLANLHTERRALLVLRKPGGRASSQHVSASCRSLGREACA